MRRSIAAAALALCLFLAPPRAGAQQPATGSEPLASDEIAHLIANAKTVDELAYWNLGGPYLAFGAGVTWLGDVSLAIAGPSAAQSDYEPGFDLRAALGYDAGELGVFGGLRVEAEASYRETAVSGYTVGGLGGFGAGASGDVRIAAGMINVLGDIWPGRRIRPYVGLGAGFAHVEMAGHGVPGLADIMDDEDFAFAWQVIAGIGVRLTPSLTLDLDYRFFQAVDTRLTTGPGTGAVPNRVDFDSHTLMLGLRYLFD